MKLKKGNYNFHKCNDGAELRVTVQEDGWERLVAIKRGKLFVWIHSQFVEN